jgi:protein-S-isoprenylcysteine O-methyltransferase Ste14
MHLFSKWAEREHSLRRRIAVLALAGIFFLFLLPLAVTRGGASLDHQLGVSAFHFGVANYVLGGALILTGMFFALWSIDIQVTRGRGTPLPMLPTQQLLTGGPFQCCRNPMTLGTLLAYSGLGIAAGTVSGVGLVVCFGALLILYLKRIEEKELAERFGDAYLAYKREVPFIIPNLRKHD